MPPVGRTMKQASKASAPPFGLIGSQASGPSLLGMPGPIGWPGIADTGNVRGDMPDPSNLLGKPLR
eukprot:9961283-Alexandrium_andersonii.AAC.1